MLSFVFFPLFFFLLSSVYQAG
uniref:Uncharacterized protein n=1 Tax=Anguilla anguilla TaxID=7936 RepID=A0A0E9QNG3_ANGAN